MKQESKKKVPPKKDARSQHQPANKKQERKKYTDLPLLGIIFLFGIIIYSNSFKCTFTFDDLNSIVNNNTIRNLSDIKAWWNFSFRHVSIFTFAVNYHFHQLDVWGYHFVNIVIHLINSYLIWWLTILIFSTPVLKDNPLSKHTKAIAFFTALLFVSHPLATQSVTYIVQRQNALAFLFYFLSLGMYVKARFSAGMHPKFRYPLFAGALVSAFLAVFSKENAFTLPFAIALFEIFFLKANKFSVNLKDYRVLLMLAGLLSIVIIIPLKFSLSIFDPLPPSLGNNYTVTSTNYLLTQFSVIVKYIQLLILPVNQNLDYDFPISESFFNIRTFLSFLFLFSLFILALFLFKKHRIFSFGIFWFFLTLSIESSFMPINDVIYEHRTYMPSFGFFLILVTGIYMLFWKKNKYIVFSILGVLILINSVLAFQRNKIWKDEFTLWNDVVAKAPGKARAINNRGFIYLQREQWDKAVSDFSKAIEIFPGWAITYYNRAVAYEKLGLLDNAIADYTTAIKFDPKYDNAYYNRGLIYGNRGNLEQALSDFTKAIESQKYIDAKSYYNRGVTYMALGQWPKAIADFSSVSIAEWKNAKAWANRGVAWANLKQWDKAIEDYTWSIINEPGFAATYNNRGNAYVHLGQWEKALADYNKALEIDPNNIDAYNNREFVYRNMNSERPQ
ncbi:MAG TPA: tetratricopeptide repeat protein [Bacteroidales bacterium]|nr:tetratricopeptide repeat protein [Bacteroidales bacterium]